MTTPHPLADTDPADVAKARTETPAPDAAAWLHDPQPQEPPEPANARRAAFLGIPLDQYEECQRNAAARAKAKEAHADKTE